MKQFVVRLVLTLSLALSMMFGWAQSASAIDRVSCSNYTYTWVLSNQTTCWANAGGRAVTLYNVIGVNAGNNRGYLRFSTGQYVNFEKGHSYRFGAQAKVVYIYIY